MATSLAATALLLTSLLPVPGVPGILEPAPEPPAESSPQDVTGSTSAESGVLRHGCKRYRYSYTVSTPYDEWSLETSVVDRRGKAVHAAALVGPSDPRSGLVSYGLCRWATRPGLFTIRGRLISYDGVERTTVQLPESQFRLRRRR